METAPGQYAYYTQRNDMVTFAGGLPAAAMRPNGFGVTFVYDSFNGRLAIVRDTSGRELELSYDSVGHLQSIADPAQGSVTYGFKAPPLDVNGQNADNLSFTTLDTVTYQDQASRRYLVSDWDYLGATAWSLATRIQGVIDELGVAYETVVYDSYGRATSSELAGGVDRFQVSAGGVTDPIGTSRTYQYSTSSGAITAIYQPAGAGCPASNSTSAFDANDNLTSINDVNGKRICYANDLTRNLETSRVEGLAGGTNCPTVTGSGATLPAGSRKISSQWHPDWRLQAKVAEPGRITTYVYNGQPDPFAGGAAASCAPAGALLPDGKPIAVLCRQVEQATTDANGAAGFSATLDGTVANREQRWSYNQWGQVLTHDGPRTDIADITTYTYYSDTSFTGTGAAAVGHTTGDLQSVSNAAGQLTQYTQYDKHGNVIQSIDPNGVVTTNSYDLRQRLLSTSVGGQTTSYSYDLAGQLKRVTRPDASWIGYDYDPAHRQTAVYDNLGNRIEYLLDNAGNRIGENVKDSAGSLRRQLARSIDALGRVQQTTGRN
ncbi:RHS repeat protein [Piscinibacter sp.]|uniref:RHS repeat protein n=1 Tax=Piscinibacter sp. TaxID=1903157 RepID=UPI0039E70F81